MEEKTVLAYVFHVLNTIRNVLKKGMDSIMVLIKLIAKTLLPSAIFTGIYIWIGMNVQSIPSIALFFVIAILTLFPFEIGVILLANKKKHGVFGLQIAFQKNEKIRLWQVLMYGFVLFGFAGLMSVTVAPLENLLMGELNDKLFSFIPPHLDWSNYELIRHYPKELLIFTSVVYLIFNVFVCPIIEELYFRGYLTEELREYGIAAPILVTVAFSLYHWWLPFNNIFRIGIFGIVAVFVYKKKDIRISMAFHCMCNLFSTIGFIRSVL